MKPLAECDNCGDRIPFTSEPLLDEKYKRQSPILFCGRHCLKIYSRRILSDAGFKRTYQYRRFCERLAIAYPQRTDAVYLAYLKTEPKKKKVIPWFQRNKGKRNKR